MHNHNELLSIGFILNFRCYFVGQAFRELILSSFPSPLFDNDDKLIITDSPISFNYDYKSPPAQKKESIYVFRLVSGNVIFCCAIDLRLNVDELTEKIISLSRREWGGEFNMDVDDRRITKNEEAIMTLFLSGFDAKKIALEEGRSIKTIYSHRRNALTKLGFKNINEYIIYKNWLIKSR
ncbi:helix-turn-helix transcriptional regulator [Serratia sp. CY54039]|uniref:helix-turn-helix domain-containing protein n=1 Tax=unclassified Serratia (in: enterobacteria) TaxID=2647522 RepID=UPI003F9F1103